MPDLANRSHQTRVGRAILSGSSIDANDPQLAEIALADTAIAECELARFIDMMLGNGENVTAHAPKAFRGFKDFLFSALGRR